MGDHSFEAHLDGKFVYCFSNEHWSSTSKEVSFNVHGIVYVPESEAPTDPLEVEGALSVLIPVWAGYDPLHIICIVEHIGWTSSESSCFLSCIE